MSIDPLIYKLKSFGFDVYDINGHNYNSIKDCFDKIHFGNEKKYYSLAQGYDTFIKSLIVDFPHQKKEINEYCKKIRDVCKKFPLYNLEDISEYPVSNEKMEGASEVINTIISDERLQNVTKYVSCLRGGR